MTTQREQKEVEAIARKIGKAIGAAIPDGLGFTFLLFDLGHGGTMAYLCNARRDDIIKALREPIENLEKQT